MDRSSVLGSIFCARWFSDSGISLKPGYQYVASVAATRLTFIYEGTRISFSQKRTLTIQVGYSDGGRSGSTSLKSPFFFTIFSSRVMTWLRETTNEISLQYNASPSFLDADDDELGEYESFCISRANLFNVGAF